MYATLCNHVEFEMSHTNHMAPYDVATMYQCDYDLSTNYKDCEEQNVYAFIELSYMLPPQSKFVYLKRISYVRVL